MLQLSGLNVTVFSGSFHVDSPPNLLMPSSLIIDLSGNCVCIMPAYGSCGGHNKHQIEPKVTEYTFRLI